MSEQNTEPIEDITEAPEVISPIEAPAATKSRKVRSELQLKALANARQKAYIVRAEKAELKKAKNETKKTQEVPQEVSIELPESHQEITDVSEEVPENGNENIRDVKEKETVVEESYIDRIERHAERKQFNDYITNLIDERVRYKPIVKSKYKLVDGSYVIR
jgi:hypothetical protein